ncbi:MAG: hypothetical protein N2422_07605 [Rhodobacteraceae bacterium]|nr:hypothetical protein [Paracoccaceae bacterium]
MNLDRLLRFLSSGLARRLLTGLVMAVIATLFPRKPRREMTEEERVADARTRELGKRMSRVSRLTRRIRF